MMISKVVVNVLGLSNFRNDLPSSNLCRHALCSDHSIGYTNIYATSILFTTYDACRHLANGTRKCACAMVVVSTKDARRERGIMPTLSIGNITQFLTVHVYLILPMSVSTKHVITSAIQEM